jgi:hypothetical protein
VVCLCHGGKAGTRRSKKKRRRQVAGAFWLKL